MTNHGKPAAGIHYQQQDASYFDKRGLRRHAHIERPYRSPFGIPGAVATLVIALMTIYFQLSDSTYRIGVIGVALWLAVGIGYFACIGRHRLILSPEEEFAMQRGEQAESDDDSRAV